MPPAAPRIRLAPGRDRSVRNGHPWIFSGALTDDGAEPEAPVVDVEDASGELLGRGFHSPAARIRVRLLSRRAVAIDRAFFSQRLARALALRERVVPPDTDGYRVLNAEGDDLPGWIVDRFGEVLVSQITCAGLDRLQDVAYGALSDAFPGRAVLHLGQVPARRGEGLDDQDRWIAGTPCEEVGFHEQGLRFRAELGGGQKTGFYCDQRTNRALAGGLSAGRSLLDLFAHSGGFSLHALRAGAKRVVLVESAERLLARAETQIKDNGLDAARAELVRADVFEHLRAGRERFDVVVCDPPPLARRRGDLERAARAYKDLNRLAFGRVTPGGFLLTFSCSGAMDSRLFRQVLFAAALEAGVGARLVAPLWAAPDHPVSIYHPEGEYLKGWLAEVGERP